MSFTQNWNLTINIIRKIIGFEELGLFSAVSSCVDRINLVAKAEECKAKDIFFIKFSSLSSPVHCSSICLGKDTVTFYC